MGLRQWLLDLRKLGTEGEEESYVHTLLLIIAISTALASGAIAVLSWIHRMPVSAITTSIGFLLSLLMFWLILQGYDQIPRRAYPLLIFVTATFLTFNNDGIHDEAAFAYPLVVVLGGLLLGKHSIVHYTLASIAALLIVSYAEINGLITTRFSGYTTYRNATIIAVLQVFISAMLYLTIDNLTRNLRRARRNELTAAESNRELQVIRDSLEEQVAERTRNAEAARQEAEDAQHALEAQMWQITGLAQLSDAVRGEQDRPTLSDAILRQMCAYLDVPVGLLYLREEGQWNAVGTYAYHPEPGHSTHFADGEGLVGEAAQAGTPRVLNSLPADYLTVSSGLGKSASPTVLIFPLHHEEEVIAVIEMGICAPTASKHLDFLHAATETIASAIHTAQTRARIDALLAQTREQANQLAVQEEELRATNEELRTQAEQWEQNRAQS